MKNSNGQHVVIAVTESCPVRRLWEAAIRSAGKSDKKVITLFLPDTRWQRAASLPFTREISSFGGNAVDFTRERAQQIDSTTSAEIQRRLEELASVSHSRVDFRVVSEAEVSKVDRIVGTGQHIVVASSVLAHQQVFAHFEKLKWQIVVVDAPGVRSENE